MKGSRTILIAVAAFLVVALTLVGAGTIAAEGPGPNGQGWGPFSGMMGGGYGGGMMGGGYGGGMMGGWPGQASPNQGAAISIEQAQQAVQSYVDGTGNKDLVVDEIVEFQNNFYVIVKENSTGIGALELLVNKYTGGVFPEYGPGMMWNTKYGMMSGRSGGMMGGWFGQLGNQPVGQATVTADQAQKAAQTWLDQYQPGSTTEKPDQFYGYYTVHILKDGKPTGMLSVNGYTGQVWYHTWHGAFVQQ